MKTKYSFFEFVEGRDGHWTIWNNKDGKFLGEVNFHKPFKKWELILENEVGFTKEYLKDVIHFIEQLEKNKHE